MSTSLSPAVSVVIPLYNKVDLVAEAIESVLSQDFEDFEIVIVDDGSTDGSGQIAQGYAERLGGRCTYVRQERAGAGAARNRGMRMANGELVAFLDADDVWIPQKLGRQVRFLQSHPDIQWCATNYWIGQRDGATHGAAVPYDEAHAGEAWIVVDWFAAMSQRHIAFQASGAMLRRSLIQQAGEFDVMIPSGQDFDYWVRIGEITPMCGYLLAPCYTLSRDSSYSITFNDPEKYSGKVRMLAPLMERSIQPGRSPAYQDLIRSVSVDMVHGSIAEGRPDVARALLRTFPKQWRGARYVGYLLLACVPASIFRYLALGWHRAGRPFRSRIRGT
ncbi:MAG TPA: glycosyltransferase family A protein [Rhodothermales bacterium]|nr:glycosyltransferase family A protein [Rhodothermales bacterium]